MSKDYAAKGVQLQMGDGATPTENFTAIAHIGDISGPNLQMDTVEVTNHGSPAKEFVPTLEDGGEITLPINWDPAETTHKNAAGGLSYALKQKAKKNWKIVYPDDAASVISFAGYVVGFDPKGPVAGKLTADIKIRVTGAVTLP